MKKAHLRSVLLMALTMQASLTYAGKEAKQSEPTLNRCQVGFWESVRCHGYLFEKLNTQDGHFQTSAIERCGTMINDPDVKCGRYNIIPNTDNE
ncbi:MAG: hypothetical protein HC904_09470 [Blastochloris sp.]|nr:hypothetical protein [Blastochloris sp.]